LHHLIAAGADSAQSRATGSRSHAALTGIELYQEDKAVRQQDELWYALAAMIGLTLVYVLIATQGIPRASGVLGHGLGILGFLLMLSTEILYSLRKRARGKASGRMSTWLQLHIFTGLVGPFVILLHTRGSLTAWPGCRC
jgi:hypothetical protein